MDVDILITGGTVITMDPQRRVIEDAGVAIAGDRIRAVGTTSELRKAFRAARVIDASRKVVMPGLIDGHGHAGHGLLKSLGTDMPGEWYKACERIYARGSTEAFWRADALLTAVERLKFGVTTGVTFFGGGDSIMRTDDPRYGDRHLEAVRQVGVRWVLAVGPRRGPFPSTFVEWNGDTAREVAVSFDDQLKTSETLIRRWHGQANGKISLAMMFPTHHPEEAALSDSDEQELIRQARAARALSKKYGLLFTQDGHSKGSVKYAHERMGILGPDALLSHATELTDEEIRDLPPHQHAHRPQPECHRVNPRPVPGDGTDRRRRHRDAGLRRRRARPQLRHVPPHVPGHALPPVPLPRRGAVCAQPGGSSECAQALDRAGRAGR